MPRREHRQNYFCLLKMTIYLQQVIDLVPTSWNLINDYSLCTAGNCNFSQQHWITSINIGHESIEPWDPEDSMYVLLIIVDLVDHFCNHCQYFR